MKRPPRISIAPAPLITRAQLAYQRSEGSFAVLSAANRRVQMAETAMSAATEAFWGVLPEGYRLHPYDLTQKPDPYFALLDNFGNDVAYPVTRCEAFNRAWQHAGAPMPSLEADPAYAAARTELDSARAAAAAAGHAIDAAIATTPEPVAQFCRIEIPRSS